MAAPPGPDQVQPGDKMISTVVYMPADNSYTMYIRSLVRAACPRRRRRLPRAWHTRKSGSPEDGLHTRPFKTTWREQPRRAYNYATSTLFRFRLSSLGRRHSDDARSAFRGRFQGIRDTGVGRMVISLRAPPPPPAQGWPKSWAKFRPLKRILSIYWFKYSHRLSSIGTPCANQIGVRSSTQDRKIPNQFFFGRAILYNLR
jgi:hypothetical protein